MAAPAALDEAGVDAELAKAMARVQQLKDHKAALELQRLAGASGAGAQPRDDDAGGGRDGGHRGDAASAGAAPAAEDDDDGDEGWPKSATWRPSSCHNGGADSPELRVRGRWYLGAAVAPSNVCIRRRPARLRRR